jgi:hypothetical protein
MIVMDCEESVVCLKLLSQHPVELLRKAKHIRIAGAIAED